MPNAIIVHGGAWDIPVHYHADHEAGCRRAAAAGWDVLAGGGSAVEAVEAAVRILEDDPTFDAGRGSHLNQDGHVELDAGIMDGRTLAAGAAAGVKRIANPITLARCIMDDGRHVFLVGEGAERFAVQSGLPLCEQSALVVPREQELWEQRRGQGGENLPAFETHARDTVGAVAVDAHGNVAVGNSTGGTFYKLPGRVGDTPIFGCGLYADNNSGAAACTGWGEQIMKTVLAKSTVDQIAWLSDPTTAANVAIAYFRHRIGGLGGVICAAPDGRVGWAHSTPYMALAYRTEGMEKLTALVSARE